MGKEAHRHMYIYKVVYSYMVYVQGVYVGFTKSLEKAIAMRDEYMKKNGITFFKKGKKK